MIDIPFPFLKSEVLTALFKTIQVSRDDTLSAGVGLNVREWMLLPISSESMQSKKRERLHTPGDGGRELLRRIFSYLRV